MSDEGVLLLALVVAICGMACFALSIAAHWKQIFGARQQSPQMRIALRLVGAGFLVGALSLCNLADPFMMAILVWPMLLLVSAGIVASGLVIHARTRRGAESGL